MSATLLCPGIKLQAFQRRHCVYPVNKMTGNDLILRCNIYTVKVRILDELKIAVNGKKPGVHSEPEPD